MTAGDRLRPRGFTGPPAVVTADGRRRTRKYAALLAVTAVVASVVACGGDDGERPAPADVAARQSEVAARGSSVMPFDLDRTTHRFAKTGTGGVQTVTADDPADTTQVELVRQHLANETERFRRGDFSDPARIHGTDMPGLAVLRNNAAMIRVDYAVTAGGGRITYATGEPGVVTALHAWFDAQVGDHGTHATGG